MNLEFVAIIAKVQTLADGGIRLTLDLPETETLIMAQMAEIKRLHGLVKINAEAYEKDSTPKANGRFD